MIPAFYNKDQDGNRVLDLADGRVLFLPRGRGGPAYVVPDYPAGLAAEQRLEWVERIALVAFIGVVLAAGFLDQWMLLFLLAPLLLVPRIVENLIVSRFLPATDSRARSGTEAPDVDAPGWAPLALFAGSAAWWFYLWNNGNRESTDWRIEIIVLGLGVVFTAAQLFRQHRTAQERRITTASGDPENKPLIPR